MNRRTALFGLGAIATGFGALFGSVAFSQVSANRGVTVEAAGDDAALLRLTAVTENSGFVSDSGGTLELTFDDSASASGSGLNYDAVTYVEPLFKIENAGNQSVGVRIGTTPNTASKTSIVSTSVDGVSGVQAFQYENNETIKMALYACATGTVSGDTDFSDSSLETLTGTDNGSIVQDSYGNASELDLQAGASVEVAFVVDSRGADTSTVSAGTDVLNEIEVVARADRA